MAVATETMIKVTIITQGDEQHDIETPPDIKVGDFWSSPRIVDSL